ncbi:nitroreductase [Longispora sp. K20-0274]|uniref:Acg family FMN-binding oxidoreductase n=1 Tax=Longispora sp. K20-0274 TaxID=3088255 RepID=UPI00399BC4AD
MNADEVLHQAVTAALRAPSILNTQPWTWRVDQGVAELWAARSRQLSTIDPDGRMLTLSCGVTLHHAITALATTGHAAEVTVFPEPGQPDLLARLVPAEGPEPTPADMRHYQSILIRHSDRRPFPNLQVPQAALDNLRAAAERVGAHLRILRPDEVHTLASAVELAEAVEISDPAYRAELAAWTHREPVPGVGVPLSATPPPASRPVAVREFDLARQPVAPVEAGDLAARYAMLFADGDSPTDWLAAGQSLGAALIAAVENGLAVSLISDVIEVATTRARLRGLLAHLGYPMMVLRVGVSDEPHAPEHTGRQTLVEFFDGQT